MADVNTIQARLMELGFKLQSTFGADADRIRAQISDLQRQLAMARLAQNNNLPDGE